MVEVVHCSSRTISSHSASLNNSTNSYHISMEASTTTKGSPTAFLKGVVGKRVSVRLNSGVDYRGVLSCLDGYMNIAMEQTEEWVNGVRQGEYGDCFIRGNNGELLRRP